MPRFLILASFDQELGEISYAFDHSPDLLAEPTDVTLGFRQVVRKCITQIHYSHGKRIPITWLDRRFTVEGIYYFRSQDTPLSETEGDIFIAGFVIHSRRKDDRLHALRSAEGLDEQGAIRALLAALPQDVREQFTDKLAHSRSFPGLTNFGLTEEHDQESHRAILLFAFFYIGKLMLWRIRRDQADVNISLEQRNFKAAIFLTAMQRSRIINIKRYQLTSNISNSQVVQSLASAIKIRLNLADEYRNDEELNTLFEEYLASLERLFTEESRRRVERGVAIFSFIAVPFTVFAALIAVVALPDGVEIFSFAARRAGSAGMWFLLGLSTAIPFMLYAAASIWGRDDRISNRLVQFRNRHRVSRNAGKPRPPRA